MAARKVKRARKPVRSVKASRARRFRVLFAAQVGRAWQVRTDQTVGAATVAAVLAPYLKNPKLTGASVTVQEVQA